MIEYTHFEIDSSREKAILYNGDEEVDEIDLDSLITDFLEGFKKFYKQVSNKTRIAPRPSTPE